MIMDNEYDFEYDLCLVSLTAMRFYEENKHRLNEVTISECSSHAIDLIDRIINKGHDEDSLDITSEIIDITSAALRAKDSIRRARITIESEADKSRVAKINSGYWWFYKQVVAYTLDMVSVVANEHKKTRPTQDIYEHFVDVRFTAGSIDCLYKTHIRAHKEISINGFINGEYQPHSDIKSSEGDIYFLFNNIARVIALDEAVKYMDYTAKESSAAKRAKAVSRFLKGDYKNTAPKKTPLDQLEISNN